MNSVLKQCVLENYFKNKIVTNKNNHQRSRSFISFFLPKSINSWWLELVNINRITCAWRGGNLTMLKYENIIKVKLMQVNYQGITLKQNHLPNLIPCVISLSTMHTYSLDECLHMHIISIILVLMFDNKSILVWWYLVFSKWFILTFIISQPHYSYMLGGLTSSFDFVFFFYLPLNFYLFFFLKPSYSFDRH